MGCHVQISAEGGVCRDEGSGNTVPQSLQVKGRVGLQVSWAEGRGWGGSWERGLASVDCPCPASAILFDDV